jgi:hypothetical protein
MKKKKSAYVAKPEVSSEEAPGFYKGYDIKWLESEPSHPDYHLVAEFKAQEKGK